MNENTVTAIGAFLAAVVGLASLAVVLGKSSQTATVLQGFGSAISNIINAATAPATGSGSNNPLSGVLGSSNSSNPVGALQGLLPPGISL